ncbi:MraY family glycosyltransferase [Haloimpatiens sp. FM7315]|uniref:MraY family glycosyltransferase n=1 Tax=Haloimpatiens sp. FM7315 TaxID=3298609 RepID=UPI00370C73C6
MRYLCFFVLVFVLVYLLIPLLIRLAHNIDFCDKPTNRKKQKEPMPLLGGVGIYIGFFITYLLFIKTIDKKSFCILISSFLILIIGIFDDWYKTKGKEFSVMPRVVVQFIAILIVYFSGITFNGFTNPFTYSYIELPEIISFLLTFTWIFGLTTVINWSDGVDGLAGTLTAIAGTTLFIVALAKNQNESAIMAILIVGAVIGFLKYNKYPAKIYMGDSGANFLGFMLAIISLDGAFKQATIMSISIPIIVLGVPIFDNIYVIIKRILRGRPIYKADSTQIHHRLLSYGFTPREVVQVISVISVGLSSVAIIIFLLNI